MVELSRYFTHDGSSRIFSKNSEPVIKLATELSFDVELAYGWNRFNLRLLGLWPDHTWKKRQANIIIRYSPPVMGIWVFSFIIAPQIFAPVAYKFAIGELIDLISAAAGISAAVIRMIILWHNGEILVWCLSFLTEDWNRTLSQKERETMTKNAKFSRNISIGVTILMQCLLWSYVILKVWDLFYLNLDAYKPTDLGKQLFYPGYCPFDISNPSHFAIVWIGQCIALMIAAVAYAGVDGLNAMLIIHICGQINILRHNLINVINDDTLQTKLGMIVKRHHELIKLASILKDSIDIMLLVVILVYTFQFALQLFRLLTLVTECDPGHFPFVEVFGYVSLLSVTFTHLCMYCYVGDMLIEESEALGWASYSCKWYNLSGNKAMDLMFVMYRAKTPLQIWAGKFVPFSLELFGNVLKTSMGYFSLLFSLKERSGE